MEEKGIFALIWEVIKDLFLGLATSATYFEIIHEVRHGLSVVFWGLIASIIIFFSNRYFNKKYPPAK